MKSKLSLFFLLAFGFILFTVIGTLTHEGGHYLMAKILGYEAKINYGAAFISDREVVSQHHQILITMAGPIETILTGTIGLLLLLIGRNKYHQRKDLRFGQWIIIFISLFWLRPVANLFVWLGGYMLTGNFSDLPDEIKISRYFHMPDGFLLLVTAIIGLIVLALVVFKFIPSGSRGVFIISGLVGGISGYVLWLRILGPILIP